MNDFGHIELMTMKSFSKCSKFYVDFENVIKLPEHVDGFEHNCVCTCCVSFCQLWRNYIWCAVNVLKTSSKISDPTNRNSTPLNLCDINGKLA